MQTTFALAAQGGNVELQRVLILAAEQEVPGPSVAAVASPRPLRVMATRDREQGFFLEHLQAASSPLVHAVLYRRLDMVRFLLDHSPFKALLDACETRSLRMPRPDRDSPRHAATTATIYAEVEDSGDFSQYGLTPLAAACAVGSVEAIDLLLEHGASKNKDVWRVRPVEGAMALGNDSPWLRRRLSQEDGSGKGLQSKRGAGGGGHPSLLPSLSLAHYSGVMRSLHELATIAQVPRPKPTLCVSPC